MVRKYMCNICGRELESHAFLRVQINYITYDKELKKAKSKTLATLTEKGTDYCPECVEKVAEKVTGAVREIVKSKLNE